MTTMTADDLADSINRGEKWKVIGCIGHDCEECRTRIAKDASQQANHLTIERLRDALVASRIIPPAAVEDPDEYDDGVTLYRIEALHRRLT